MSRKKARKNGASEPSSSSSRGSLQPYCIRTLAQSIHRTSTDLSGNSVWPQALGFQKSPKLTILDIFDELLSTQNVNLTRFTRNVE